MKAARLIELLEREDPDAEVVQRVEHLFYKVERLVECRLTPTQVRNMHTNVLVPGFKQPPIPGEGKSCVEAQH
jgi:hypothetical protein